MEIIAAVVIPDHAYVTVPLFILALVALAVQASVNIADFLSTFKKEEEDDT